MSLDRSGSSASKRRRPIRAVRPNHGRLHRGRREDSSGATVHKSPALPNPGQGWRVTLPAVGGVATGIGGVITVLLAIAALVYTNQNNVRQQQADRQQLQLVEQGQITDRFARAVDQVGQQGTQKIDVRLGAVYSLQRIMHDSRGRIDQPAVTELLSAFIRVHAVRPSGRPASTSVSRSAGEATMPVDIQAALTVLDRRDTSYDPPDYRLSLRNANLAHAYLSGGGLRAADLSHADLSGADMEGMRFEAGASLVDATLRRASLRRATVTSVDLQGADLAGADMSEADLAGATLMGVGLRGTWLGGARLSDASLECVDLSGAHLQGAHLENMRAGQFFPGDRTATTAVYQSLDVTRPARDFCSGYRRLVNLAGADLSSADLTGADFGESNLKGAILTGAVLLRTKLASVSGLTTDQIRCALVDETTELPRGVGRPIADAPHQDPACFP